MTKTIYVTINQETAGPHRAFEVEADALAYNRASGRREPDVRPVLLFSTLDAEPLIEARAAKTRARQIEATLETLKQRGIGPDIIERVRAVLSVSPDPTDAELVEMGKLYVERARGSK